MPPILKPRDRQQTEQKLIDALGRVLARDGFERCGVNAVAREARVDKVLIYRYFSSMSGLLQAYGTSSQFWPPLTEILGSDHDVLTLPAEKRLASILLAIYDALQQRPQTLTIMAWELVQRNPLTDALASVRENWSQQLIAAALPADELESLPAEQILTLANLLVAGMQYLLLRGRSIALFGGLPLQDKAGREQIGDAIVFLAHHLLERRS